MIRQPIFFEWLLDEGDRLNWNPSIENLDNLSLPSSLLISSGEERILYAVLRTLLLVVVPVIVAAGAALSPQDHARQLAEAGVASSVRLENMAWRSNDRDLFARLVDRDVERFWIREWRDYWPSKSSRTIGDGVELIAVEAEEEIAIARVRISPADAEWWESTPYQENRVYRPTEQGWLRTMPGPGFWGERGELETAHLRFLYHERDRRAVKEAAPRIEQAYVALYRLLDMDLPGNGRKLTVAVMTDISEGWRFYENRLDVSSPWLSRMPDGLSDGDFLAQTIVNWITYRAVRDASPRPTGEFLYRWAVMIWGMRNWLRADILGEPSPWQVQATEIFRHQSEGRLPISLDEIIDLSATERPGRDEVIWRFMAAESVVAYAVETYGRDKLPVFLNGIVYHNTWGTLIPAIYGHSAEEFADGWNHYIAAKYDLEIP